MEQFFEFIYNHKQNILVIKDLQNEPMFNSNDIGIALKLESKMKDLIRKLDPEDKVMYKDIDIETHDYTNDYQSDSWFLTLSGLFSIVFKSKRRLARKFKRWVIRDVLPTLYHTGEYHTSPEYLAMKQTIDELLDELSYFKNKNLKTLKPGIFYIGEYILIIKGKKVKVVKIGITTRLNQRVREHQKVWPTFELCSYFNLNNGLSMRELESAIKPILRFKATFVQSTRESFYGITSEEVQDLVLGILKYMNPSKGTCVRCNKSMDPKREVVCFDCFPVDINEELSAEDAIGGRPIYIPYVGFQPKNVTLAKMSKFVGEQNTKGRIITQSYVDRMYKDVHFNLTLLGFC